MKLYHGSTVNIETIELSNHALIKISGAVSI